jgi:hypothetical protein
MKIAGALIAVIGGAAVGPALTMGLAIYDLHSTDQLIRFVVGVGIWSLVTLGGLALFIVGSKESKRTKSGY